MTLLKLLVSWLLILVTGLFPATTPAQPAHILWDIPFGSDQEAVTAAFREHGIELAPSTAQDNTLRQIMLPPYDFMGQQVLYAYCNFDREGGLDSIEFMSTETRVRTVEQEGMVFIDRADEALVREQVEAYFDLTARMAESYGEPTMLRLTTLSGEATEYRLDPGELTADVVMHAFMNHPTAVAITHFSNVIASIAAMTDKPWSERTDGDVVTNIRYYRALELTGHHAIKTGAYDFASSRLDEDAHPPVARWQELHLLWDIPFGSSRETIFETAERNGVLLENSWYSDSSFSLVEGQDIEMFGQPLEWMHFTGTEDSSYFQAYYSYVPASIPMEEVGGIMYFDRDETAKVSAEVEKYIALVDAHAGLYGTPTAHGVIINSDRGERSKNFLIAPEDFTAPMLCHAFMNYENVCVWTTFYNIYLSISHYTNADWSSTINDTMGISVYFDRYPQNLDSALNEMSLNNPYYEFSTERLDGEVR